MALIQCTECGGNVSTLATSCPRCGSPVGGIYPQVERAQSVLVVPSAPPTARPTALLWVGGILGGLGVLSSGYALYSAMSGDRFSSWDVQQALFRKFPDMEIMTLFGNGASVVGYCALGVGIVLAYVGHRSAARVIRITCLALMAFGVAMSLANYVMTTGADAWSGLDSYTRSGMIFGFVAGAAMSVIMFGLVLWLTKRAVSNGTLSSAATCNPTQ